MPKTLSMRPKPLSALVGGISLLASAAILSSCVTETRKVEDKETDLAAAGFVAQPADTPERQAMLRRLPPNKFLTRARGNNVSYVYADPVNCKCLYVGNQQAYSRYSQARQQQRIVDRQLLAAQTYADAQWNWGIWGPSEFYDFDGPYGPGAGW